MRLDFCVACGERDVAKLEHHHLIPRSAGGSRHETNLITLCYTCHGKAHGYERQHHGALTKAGLAAAKARGVKLGRQNVDITEVSKGRSAKVAAFRATVLPEVQRLIGEGMSERQAAKELNRLGLTTYMGKPWRYQTVNSLLNEGLTV